MNIIALSGKKRSGKNQVAQFIAEAYGKKVKVENMAFADSLKEEVAKACAVTVEEIEKNKENYREILQFWGTNYRRKFFGDEYWIRKLFEKMNASNADIITISDCRFLNEAKAIRALGGYIIRIVRPTHIDFSDTHPSEIELDNYNFDFIVANNGNLDDLYASTKQIIQKLRQLK